MFFVYKTTVSKPLSRHIPSYLRHTSIIIRNLDNYNIILYLFIRNILYLLQKDGYIGLHTFSSSSQNQLLRIWWIFRLKSKVRKTTIVSASSEDIVQSLTRLRKSHQSRDRLQNITPINYHLIGQKKITIFLLLVFAI